jgi:hypothetical protein
VTTTDVPLRSVTNTDRGARVEIWPSALDDKLAARVHIRDWLNPERVMCGGPETESLCCVGEWLDFDRHPIECHKCFKVVCPECLVAVEARAAAHQESAG